MQAEFWDDRFKKRKNSTKRPDFPGVVKEVVIKGNFGFENQFQSTKCSTIAPSFFVKDVAGYGYCKVWNNYYWITNISFDIDGAEYIECRVDVLASWANFIKASTFFVERCADPTYYNTDIYDAAISVEDGVEVTSQANTDIFGGWSINYIVRVMGGGGSGIGDFVFGTLSEVGEVFNAAFQDIDDAGDLLEVFKAWATVFFCNPADYVVSCKIAPLKYADIVQGSSEIYCGWFGTGITKPTAGSNKIYEATLNKPSNLYSDFRRTDPRVSIYYIYFPGVGTVELASDLIETTLTVMANVDLKNGNVTYVLKSNGSVVGNYDGCLYSELPMSGTGGSFQAMIQTMSGIGGALSSAPNKVVDVLDADTAVTALEGGSALGVASGVVTALQGIGAAIKGQTSVCSASGSIAKMLAQTFISISAVQKHTGEFLTADYGRPCCKNLQLGQLNGFVQCANASIEIAAVKGIREEINTYLNTGVFIE